MNSFATIALATLAFAYLTSAAYWEHPNKKSFYTIQQECADAFRIDNDTLCQIIANGYPQDNQTCSLVYCMLNKMRAWENNTEKSYVLGNFFQPADSDCTYVNRTQQCVNETVPPVCQSSEFDRACKTFICYYRNYGEVKSEAQFLPFNQAEKLGCSKFALQVTNASCSDLEQIANGNVTNTTAFVAAWFVHLINGGYYTNDQGVNYKQLYTQFGNPALLTEDTRTCVTKVERQSCTEPQRSLDIFNTCMPYTIETNYWQLAASELRYGSNSTCVICTTTPAPCPTTTTAAPCETTTTTPAPETTTPCGGAPNTTVTEFPVTNSTEPIQNTTTVLPVNTTQPCYNGQC